MSDSYSITSHEPPLSGPIRLMRFSFIRASRRRLTLLPCILSSAASSERETVGLSLMISTILFFWSVSGRFLVGFRSPPGRFPIGILFTLSVSNRHKDFTRYYSGNTSLLHHKRRTFEFSLVKGFHYLFVATSPRLNKPGPIEYLRHLRIARLGRVFAHQRFNGIILRQYSLIP